MLFKRDGYHKIQQIHRKNCSRYEYAEIEALHHVHMTNPELVAPVINDFLDRCSS